MSERLFYFSPSMDATEGGSDKAEWPSDIEPSDRDSANLISSLCEDGKHRPVIDIDFPCRLVPSSTEGHFHLYIDVPMEWHQCKGMLDAMVVAGVVQAGFANASGIRGMTLCRPEWVKKLQPLIDEDQGVSR